jgi:hypothetical protein
MALHAIRYGIPVVLFIAGAIVMATAGGVGLAAGALFFSAATAVLLLNVLHRIGVEGDRERDAEQEARDFFEEHRHWPDESPSAARGRPRA